MGVCVPNFRSVSFSVWPGDVIHMDKYIHTYTNIGVNLRISSTGCSPHVDFDNNNNNNLVIISMVQSKVGGGGER